MPIDIDMTSKGHSQNEMADLDMVGWFLGGQKSTRVENKIGKYFCCFFNSPPLETPKISIKKIEGETVHFLGRYFCFKKFDTTFLLKFFLVFLNPPTKKHPNAINPKKSRGK
jgi:hypothetical protein